MNGPRALAAAVSIAAALALAGAGRAGDAEPISVRVSLDRDSVRVHEQVLLSVEVTHPVDARATWEPPPLDGFWVERLGMRALPDAPNGLHRTEFRRALFPTRPGLLEIGVSKLVIDAVDGSRDRDLPVPGTSIRVEALPAGVPPDVLVGKLELHLGVDDRVRLGKSVTLIVELAGETNVWDAKAPDVQTLVGPDVDVFPEPAKLSIGENAGRATTRRQFRYALVPARAGRLAIPPLEIPYFDPARGAVVMAKSDALAVDVIEGSAADEPHLGFTPSPHASGRSLPLWPFALAGVAALGAALFVRRRRRGGELARTPAGPKPHEAFDAARNARGTREFPALLARAVRVGIGVQHRLDAHAFTSDELAAKIDDREALELLTALDQMRFAGRPADENALLERTRQYLRL